MRPDRSPGACGDDPQISSAILEVDAATVAQTIRQQRALPITDAEADALARSIEVASSDEERLANTLAAVRLLVDRLELPGGMVDGDHDHGEPARIARHDRHSQQLY
jgi:hypothetical protein